VVAYAKRRPNLRAHRGRFIELAKGSAVDVWLSESMNYLVSYEMQRYNAQRPIAYTNWPTLDPLTHITESTKEEQAALVAMRGEKPDTTVKEYDNDAIGLDARAMRATAAFPAGIFASYHAYPYYPDFMVLDPAYNRAASPEGPSTYFGYLRDLVAHHKDMPVLISEYGVPSSRGMAHWQPQGWHHGGHDERGQAEVDARLTRDIHAAGAAGAVLFAAIDEWFKKNWLVIDFEQPLERNRLWLNALDAEQNYGVIAMRPGRRDSAITIDGKSDDWRSVPCVVPCGHDNGRAAQASGVVGAQRRGLRVPASRRRTDRLDACALPDWHRYVSSRPGRYALPVHRRRIQCGLRVHAGAQWDREQPATGRFAVQPVSRDRFGAHVQPAISHGA